MGADDCQSSSHQERDRHRLLLDLQNDVIIAVARVLDAYEDGELEGTDTRKELIPIENVVLEDVAIEDEQKTILIDNVQTSLLWVFVVAEQYFEDGATSEASIKEYIEAERKTPAIPCCSEEIFVLIGNINSSEQQTHHQEKPRNNQQHRSNQCQ